jgi:hypothetical protein
MRGIGESEPVSFTNISSATAYALTAANKHDAAQPGGGNGLAFAAKSSDLLRTLFEVRHSGTIVRPNAASQSIFKVLRDDGTTAFEVSSTGIGTSSVSTGSETFITDSSTSTLTNKTISGGIITSSKVSNNLDFFQNTSAPAAPDASYLKLYALTGDNQLRIKNSSGTAFVIADLSTAQEMTNKILTSPTITGAAMSAPVISNYAQFTQGAAPSNPGAGSLRIYARNAAGTSGLFFKSADDTEKEVVDLSTAQTLSNKTFGAGISFTTPTLSAPTISNYIDMTQLVTRPGADASKVRVWMKNDNNLYMTLPGSASDIVFFNSSNASTVAAVGFARNMALGGL